MHNDTGSEKAQYYLKQKGIRDACCTVDIIACSNGHGTLRHGGGTSRGGAAIYWGGMEISGRTYTESTYGANYCANTITNIICAFLI